MNFDLTLVKLARAFELNTQLALASYDFCEYGNMKVYAKRARIAADIVLETSRKEERDLLDFDFDKMLLKLEFVEGEVA